LLIHLAIDEQNEHRWCLWRPDHERFDSRSIFESALIEKYAGIQKNALKSDKSGVEKVPTNPSSETAAIPLGSWRTSFAGRRDEPSVIAWRIYNRVSAS
jgi:hypothetical protein